MNIEYEREQHYRERIRTTIESGDTDSELGKVLARWKDHDIVIWRDGKWLYEGFILYFKKLAETLSTIDPSIPPDVPPHLLDPAQVASLFGIPAEEFNCWHGEPEGKASKEYRKLRKRSVRRKRRASLASVKTLC